MARMKRATTTHSSLLTGEEAAFASEFARRWHAVSDALARGWLVS